MNLKVLKMIPSTCIIYKRLGRDYSHWGNDSTMVIDNKNIHRQY